MTDGRRITADWLQDADVREVLDALTREGAHARFVGGCVRNALLGAGATDIDVAVDRPPEEATRLVEAAGLKSVPTGFDHGTITAVTREKKIPVEVTSLRRDVETDGRRAVVAFTDDWAEDAMRRDFTMNALYADAEGAVYDPLGGGVADLAARRVRFIGRAEDRIREDALRILRFFRFTARYGSRSTADPADLAAIRALKEMIPRLARERIGQEIRKLLGSPAPVEAAMLAAETGALGAAFAPLAPPDPARLGALLAAEAAVGAEDDAMRRLALIAEGSAAEIAERLRLSKAEQRRLEAIAAARARAPGDGGYRNGFEAARDAALLRAAETGDMGDALAAAIAAARRGADAVPPVSAADLIAAGFAPGPDLGAALKDLEARWIASDFSLDQGALLALAVERKVS